MDIETRVTNLENMLASIVDTLSNNKIYTDADIAGVRKSVSDVTPYIETKTAYISDTQMIFNNVPSGNLSVYFDKPYTVEREADRITITFEALEEVTPITISII
jgi:hypothetical protein